ncbi:hypothetical protein HNQ88_004457 [Aureibacter tunicatorum]|uniref:Uncharacterized protein n=1 Tax=Aureibacter tunicatorum TaxID=866807 RepID=A0AAE3XRJ9_9BACT|nr:hypothetical protein [Aureibacter tunicatorum]BDD06785.1 hypothetical protein AUTU_42680 [Aureibacter tunicatorum]
MMIQVSLSTVYILVWLISVYANRTFFGISLPAREQLRRA